MANDILNIYLSPKRENSVGYFKEEKRDYQQKKKRGKKKNMKIYFNLFYSRSEQRLNCHLQIPLLTNFKMLMQILSMSYDSAPGIKRG